MLKKKKKDIIVKQYKHKSAAINNINTNRNHKAIKKVALIKKIEINQRKWVHILSV